MDRTEEFRGVLSLHTIDTSRILKTISSDARTIACKISRKLDDNDSLLCQLKKL